MPIIIRCLRSDQEGLPGEKDSALEANSAPEITPGSWITIKDLLSETKRTNMVFVVDVFVLFWMKNAKQDWFGDNGLSVYMGFNNPQKLFMMPDHRSLGCVWENPTFGL